LGGVQLLPLIATRDRILLMSGVVLKIVRLHGRTGLWTCVTNCGDREAVTLLSSAAGVSRGPLLPRN